MTVLRHIDHGVTCDDVTHGTGEPTPCDSTVWQSEVQDRLPSHAIGEFRKLLKKRGWLLGVEPSAASDRREPLDFCPTHAAIREHGGKP